MSDDGGTKVDGRNNGSMPILDRAIEAVRSQTLCEESLENTLSRMRSSVPCAPPRRASRVIGRRWLVAASTAAAITVAATAWLWRPSVSWAQVAEALRGKPWIHAVGKARAAESSEFWFSFQREVYADRRGDWAMFDDTRLQVRYEFDPKESRIVRSLMPDVDDASSLSELLRGVSLGKVRTGLSFSGREVIAQEQRRVVENEREWLEYDLTLRAGKDLTENRLARMRFRVDPESHLLKSMTLSEITPPRENGREPYLIEFTFDYPNDGPADIYDLGVPRDAKLVDRVPSADLSRIVAAVESGRYRFDDYVAVVTKPRDFNSPWYAVSPDAVFWRKGDCWRADIVLGPHNDMPWPPAAPPDDIDRGAWWHAQLKHFDRQAVEICDGTTVYQHRDGGSKPFWEDEWKAKTKVTPGKSIDEALMGLVRDRVLEGYAYPYGVQKPAHVFTVEIDPHSTEGPLDCVLVKYLATDAVKGNDTFRDCRYWVDPTKSYVARQYFFGDCRGADGSATTETMTMEDFERSPHGFWYPTLIRRKVTRDPSPGGNWSGETVTRYFLDFKADIPDELFRPADPSAANPLR